MNFQTLSKVVLSQPIRGLAAETSLLVFATVIILVSGLSGGEDFHSTKKLAEFVKKGCLH